MAEIRDYSRRNRDLFIGSKSGILKVLEAAVDTSVFCSCTSWVRKATKERRVGVSSMK